MCQMSEVKELLAMHVRAFNERAWGRASEIYAPDLVVIEPAGTVHGIDAFLGHAQGFTTAFPDSRMEVTTIIESGDQAVHGRRLRRYEHRSTGYSARRDAAHRPETGAALV